MKQEEIELGMKVKPIASKVKKGGVITAIEHRKGKIMNYVDFGFACGGDWGGWYDAEELILVLLVVSIGVDSMTQKSWRRCDVNNTD